ncbi:DUF6215 domain-containing protein [Streptomyces alanosinicus]|uniref:Uncharacterized protein n=1 Tax=Streptomyces alanosinicus TaxID=68171 RepID=A0A918INZ4_9ACTN|nr:DUF6215 domain-containing protein [Streptomyces alanosinicus]GGW23384.1 hypothetical protein GCM10010339_93310 [Streptomyces alanosinicus]
MPDPPPAEKEPSHLGRAVAAVAIFGLVGALLWRGQDRLPGSIAASPANPASCSSSEHDELPREYKTSRAVSGYELCKALNQPDLALFLGTPGEKPTTASGSNTLVDKDPAPEAEVDFDTCTVQLSAGFKVSVAEWVALLSLGKQDSVKTFTVLGRPAVFSSSRAMRMNLDPVNGSSADGNGPPVRTLYVARDKGDRGGMYHIAVWSKSGALPTDRALVRIAEKVLPALSGR